MMLEIELENMKFYELKILARKCNISGPWSTKREIINQLLALNSEDLDSVLLTLRSSPGSSGDNSASLESEVVKSSGIPQQTFEPMDQNTSQHYSGAVTRASAAKTRLFPKLRMTVFQTERMTVFQTDEDDDSADENRGYSRRGRKKYFPTSYSIRKSEVGDISFTPHNRNNDNKENETMNSHTEAWLSSTFDIQDKVNNDISENTEKRKRSRSLPENSAEKNNTPQITFFTPIINTEMSQNSQQRVKGTPRKVTKIPKFKMTDFKSIHKKEFEKMESVFDSHQRKIERAKTLLTPNVKGKKPASNIAPPVMVFSAQPSPYTMPHPMKPFITQNYAQGSQHVPQPAFRMHNNFQPVKSNPGRLIQRNDIKQIITSKLPIQSQVKKAQEALRNTLKGVRLNRRFVLQMAHRKLA